MLAIFSDIIWASGSLDSALMWRFIVLVESYAPLTALGVHPLGSPSLRSCG